MASQETNTDNNIFLGGESVMLTQDANINTREHIETTGASTDK
ncbi:hypothetical protein ACFLQ6_09480 [Thermoproteota archaeon]